MAGGAAWYGGGGRGLVSRLDNETAMPDPTSAGLMFRQVEAPAPSAVGGVCGCGGGPARAAACAPGGGHDWPGGLPPPDGPKLAAFPGGGRLYRGKRVEFLSPGPPIRQAGVDGAYALRDVVITHRTMPTLTAVLPLVYTAPLQASQFDAWGFDVTGAGAQAVDANANGLYDKLLFTTTLDIPLPGAYYLHYALVSQQAPDTALLAIEWSWWYAQGQVTKAVALSLIHI